MATGAPLAATKTCWPVRGTAGIVSYMYRGIAILEALMSPYLFGYGRFRDSRAPCPNKNWRS